MTSCPASSVGRAADQCTKGRWLQSHARNLHFPSECHFNIFVTPYCPLILVYSLDICKMIKRRVLLPKIAFKPQSHQWRCHRAPTASKKSRSQSWHCSVARNVWWVLCHSLEHHATAFISKTMPHLVSFAALQGLLEHHWCTL